MVYMNISIVEKILSFHAFAPLDACTYYGLDNGADPIQVRQDSLVLVREMTLIMIGSRFRNCGENTDYCQLEGWPYLTERSYDTVTAVLLMVNNVSWLLLADGCKGHLGLTIKV